jgi:uncharacterized protein
VMGLDGWEAVRLWHQWCGGNEAARDLLLRYNAADTQNLELLAAQLYDEMVVRFGPPSVGFPIARSQRPIEVAP